MKIAITDWTFPDLRIEELIVASHGGRVEARQCKTEQDLIELVNDADAVVTQFARLTPPVIGAMSKSRAIVRYGIGVDNVDLEAAHTHGIPVCNVPDYCIDEVADHTLALILSLTRQVVVQTQDILSGHWRLAVPLTEMKVLRETTVGVVGFGRIGREVARRLLAFKCQILVHDPMVSASSIEAAGATTATLLEILSAADVLTLHCPSTPATRRLIDEETLARMKRGAILINVARGDLVDTLALSKALENGALSAAALDVFDPEPIPLEHPIRKFSNVILTPHIASASPTAVKALRETSAGLAVKAARGELPQNIVNGITTPRLFQ